MATLDTVMGYLEEGRQIALDWISSPAAYAQFALLVVAYLAAVVLARMVTPRLRRLIDPGPSQTRIAIARRFVLVFLPLLLPLVAYGLTAGGEAVTRSLFGSGAVIAFGKRVFIFLAVRMLVRDAFRDPFLKLMGRYVFVPMAAIYAVGLMEPLELWLGETVVGVGDIRFSVLALLRAAIAGSLLFWLGQWSAGQGTDYIRAREEMRPPIRELAAKAFELTVYSVAFLLLVNIIGLDLSALAIMGGAIGVGLGFGLQKIASNFISGVILLLEGQASVGDYVELDGGQAGTIRKLGARATTLETFDGKWILVPNEDFITTRVTNWSDAGSANRCEAEFAVAYESDLEEVVRVVIEAVSAHPQVLQEPEPPDCEIRAFADSGVEMAVEFWMNGIDDGPNRVTADLMMIIWKALKSAGIDMPFPQREIRIRDAGPLAGLATEPKRAKDHQTA